MLPLMRPAPCALLLLGAACAAASPTPPSRNAPLRPDSDDLASDGACPPAMAHVVLFCIDRWEASLVLVGPSGDETPLSPYETVNDRKVKAVSLRGVVPHGYVSQLDAKAACDAAGKRLCQEDEWVAACKGPQKTTFPYGNTREPGRCNGEATISPLSFMPANQQFPDMTNMNNPKLDQLPGTLTKTGERAGCTNAYGVFDMVGNLHEWVSADKIWGAEFLGGYFRDTAENGDGCNYKTTAHQDFYHDYSTGFRCCKDAAR
jgi:sulfatase modifying factor 1